MKPAIIDLGGKQVTVSSDDRAEGIWLQVWANKGSLGVELTRKQALELRRALFDAVYPTGSR